MAENMREKAQRLYESDRNTRVAIVGENIRYLVIVAVMILMLLGAGLRLWGMPGGMLFSIDQARDYRLAVGVLEEGVGSLPLLGALAGGTDFRLGPIHNYFQILGLWLTGVQEPYGIMIVEVFLSIGLIGLVYLLMRGFFRRNIKIRRGCMYQCVTQKN